MRDVADRLVSDRAALAVGAAQEVGDVLPARAPGTLVNRVELGPLTVDALDELLVSRLELSLSRPRLKGLHRLTGGNPYFALEIARPLRDRAPEPDDDLHVPGTLRKALHRRLATLSKDARGTLVLLAASPSLAASDLEELTGSADGIAEAVEAEIVLLDGDGVRFSHPLLASVAYDDAGESGRRKAHLRLAAGTGRQEERALHLALATAVSDEAIAQELERAAEESWARGAPETAARLLQHAGRLTPDDREADATRRLTAAAEHLQTAGDLRRSRALYVALVDRLPASGERAHVLARLAELESDPSEAARLARQSIAEAGDDLALKAGMLLGLFHNDRDVGAFRSAVERAGEAARLAETLGDKRLLAMALTRILALSSFGDCR